MTQKIFDTDNEKDMALLWSILTDTIKIIKRPYKSGMVHPFSASVDTLYLGDDVIKINWHDKTEIIRPIKEATKEDYKKLCLFRDDNSSKGVVGVLSAVDSESVCSRYYMEGGTWWRHCRILTKQEIEELC